MSKSAHQTACKEQRKEERQTNKKNKRKEWKKEGNVNARPRESLEAHKVPGTQEEVNLRQQTTWHDKNENNARQTDRNKQHTD